MATKQQTKAQTKAAKGTAMHNEAHDAKMKAHSEAKAKEADRLKSNSAAHDKAIEAARAEAQTGFDMMTGASRSTVIGQQYIAHAIIALEAEEAFNPSLGLAKWDTYSAKQQSDKKATVIAFLLGKAPAKTKPGEETPVDEADKAMKYRANRTAVGRALMLAAAITQAMAARGNAKPAIMFDKDKGWTVPIGALCPRDMVPFDPAVMVSLDNHGVHVKGKTGGLVAIRCSVDQILSAAVSRAAPAAPAATGDGKGEDDKGNGANDTDKAREKEAMRVVSFAKLAENPSELVDLWHRVVRVYREEPLSSLDDKIIGQIMLLQTEIGAFLTERARDKRKITDLPTTAVGRALVKAQADKASAAK